MKVKAIAGLAGLILVSGCGGGGGGVQAPAQFEGIWGADCSSPFVSFKGNTIHVYPDNADYKLKSADFANGNLTVSYDSAQGAVSEVYAAEGSTLRLDHGTYAGSEATWHKQPMNKCGG